MDTVLYQYSNSNWKDQLTNYNGKNINYDGIGNPINIGDSITLEWINGRSLKSYTDDSKKLMVEYQYNMDGIRTSKVVNGKKIEYSLENNNIVYEKRENKLIYYFYDSTGLLGFEYEGNKYYYIKNLQNDIVGITDSSYNQIVVYEYDPWGKVLNIKDNQGNEITDANHIGIINPFRYRGYYYDSETNLYYLNSRYYSPELCRFLNADSYIKVDNVYLSYNLYIYANNNPINYLDTSGNFFKSVLKWISNKVNDIVNKATQIAKTLYNIVTKSDFVIEAEIGLGLGGGASVTPTSKVNAGFSKTVGVGYSNNKTYQYTSSYIGADVSSSTKQAGLSLEIRNYDNGKGNPMVLPFEIWDDENTVITSTVGLKENTKIKKTDIGIDGTNDEVFIGLTFEAFLFAGGRIKIGFNIGG